MMTPVEHHPTTRILVEIDRIAVHKLAPKYDRATVDWRRRAARNWERP